MGKLIEDLKGMGYHFQEGNPVNTVAVGEKNVQVNELRVESPEGQIILLKRDLTPILFPGDTDGLPENDWTGEDGIRTNCAAIYTDFYGLDEEAACMLLYNYSLRTRHYLESERQRIGLTSVKEGSPEAFFVLDEFNVGMGVGLMEVGRYADGRFVAQSSGDSLYEDADVLRMHFTHLPDQRDVEDAMIIRKMERDFKLGRHRETFTCSDCFEKKHWLDIPGSIQEKLALRLMRKCGCTQMK
ncbi:MAG: hypothetical protein AB9880_09830 [Christensenellales bacterium]